MRRTWSAALVALALAACENPVEWDGDVVLERRALQTTADSATVVGARQGIEVQGVYRAPGTGYALRAWSEASAGTLTVYVEGTLPSGGTHPATTGLGYRVTIGRPAGTYTVRVVHQDQGSGNPNPREVATARVTVGRD